MKSGIARIKELYPDQDSFEAHVRANKSVNWTLVARRNPMGVVSFPGVAWIGEDKGTPPPAHGLKYSAFFEDLYGIRAGALCLASDKTLIGGLAKLLRDEFAAASLYKRLSCRQGGRAEVCQTIIGQLTGMEELYPMALIRAGIALAAERELDRDTVARILARVA